MTDRLITGLLFIIMLLAIGVMVNSFFVDNNDPAPTAHRCNAPCTVVLPPNTLEDEFWFDYGWEDGHTSVVRVYKCKGEVNCYRKYGR